MDRLFYRATWDAGREEIKKALGEDTKGIKILTCVLKCGMKTYENYLSHGTEEEILIDTMKCFQRFIEEHRVSYGTFAFDRDFWTARQISGNLLRIGELEYELVQEKDKKYISIHIPPDTKMTGKKFWDSYEKAKEFMKKFFPEYQDADVVCDSWLLSPALQNVLPENSNILRFQKAFMIEQAD